MEGVGHYDEPTYNYPLIIHFPSGLSARCFGFMLFTVFVSGNDGEGEQTKTELRKYIGV